MRHSAIVLHLTCGIGNFCPQVVALLLVNEALVAKSKRDKVDPCILLRKMMFPPKCQEAGYVVGDN